ncbi:hypothetical protein [Streptomyces phaeoluteigriseus]|uniref:hypothetical protein n=1 Tax=Streptomyces phaeoluteigriseus TaxID=114686 RepID=UPI0009292053|nr:hypothetical protein [Streptomyces phaeoluteigriseus]
MPLDRLPAARKTKAFRSHVLSAAQKDFGDLITLAARGEPQVLLRNTTPVAVPLPADPSALSSDTVAYPGAAPAGHRVEDVAAVVGIAAQQFGVGGTVFRSRGQCRSAVDLHPQARGDQGGGRRRVWRFSASMYAR